MLFSEKNADLCTKIELKILEFSYRSNLYCMGLLEKRFRSGIFHVPVCYFLIKITSLYINREKLSGKCIYLYMCIHFLFSLPSSSHPGESIYTILYNFVRDLHSSLASLGQLFFPFQTLDAAGRGCRLIFSFNINFFFLLI